MYRVLIVTPNIRSWFSLKILNLLPCNFFLSSSDILSPYWKLGCACVGCVCLISVNHQVTSLLIFTVYICFSSKFNLVGWELGQSLSRIETWLELRNCTKLVRRLYGSWEVLRTPVKFKSPLTPQKLIEVRLGSGACPFLHRGHLLLYAV